MTADLQVLLDAYADALTSFHALAAELDDTDWARPTDCPGWSVREQVAHVLALELQLAGQPAPPRLPAYPAHVRGPSGEHMESGIAALADVPTGELVARLGRTADEHLAQLRALALAEDTTVVGTLGTPVPLPRFLPIRVLDVWTHEQDVRGATGRPGGLSGPAAVVAVGQITDLLPYVVGSGVAPAPGSSVAVAVSGEVPVATTVTVQADGQAAATAGIAPDATVTLRMGTETLGRLAGGRVDPAAAAVEFEGDADLGQRVLAELAIAP
jgi:uncharacterized protein (TIGR03083 family)